MSKEYYTDIIIDAPFDRDELCALVKPYAVITDKEYDVIWLPEKLSIRKKIVVRLLIQLIFADIGIDRRELTPSQLEEQLRVNGSSMRPILKWLVDTQVVTAKNGLYYIKPQQFTAVQKELAYGRDKAE